ncbi:hypothetical protein RM780_12005 [Streptomyces sp. DSM 44917]|uniref:Uncharacterized protein n=1 Tax=Streptomyces boetiae TaxID=3075541 RepID=A0ABU2L7Z7_9ACTN|nr:hypothetical protein [Streptomyces sp. DSM 44917]MDT0307682.1 hypothetical protein [Streptomyces sp. DSM 44917]
MSQDPREPETLEEFLAEEREEAELFEPGLADESPEADTAEQRAALLPLPDAPPPALPPEEADPADAAEQARIVDPGEDEYR